MRSHALSLIALLSVVIVVAVAGTISQSSLTGADFIDSSRSDSYTKERPFAQVSDYRMAQAKGNRVANLCSERRAEQNECCNYGCGPICQGSDLCKEACTDECNKIINSRLSRYTNTYNT